MKIETIQVFKITYEVPTEEEARFQDMLAEGEDIGEYEVDQEFLKEIIVGTRI